MRPFSTIFVIVLFFRRFSSKWPSFSISQKYSLFNRNFKNKNSRIFPPSQYFFVAKAFIRFFFVSPEGCAVPSGRMAHYYRVFRINLIREFSGMSLYQS